MFGRLTALVLLASISPFVACNSGVGTQADVVAGAPVAQDDTQDDIQDDTQDDTQDDVDDTEDDDGVAGIYVGDVTCIASNYLLGELIDVDTTTHSLTRVFSSEGLPVIDGVEAFVGQQSEEVRGPWTVSYTKTDILQTSTGVVLYSDAEYLYDCGNTCQWAFDGMCDEIRYCDWGTDCADCGPIRWDHEITTTYRFLDDGTIERTVAGFGIEAELGNDTTIVDCSGILSP